jgi:hypothetical protein
MKNTFYIFALSFLYVTSIYADGLSKGKKDSILIAGVNVPASLVESSKAAGTYKELERLSESLGAQLEVAISSTRIFQIVERERLNELQLETDFNASGGTGSEVDVKQFDVTGAKYVLFPKVTAYELKKAVSKYGAIDRQSTSVIISATVNSKIVDTSTGIALPDIVSINKSIIQNYDLSKIGTVISVDILVDNLSKKISDATAWGLVNMLRPPKVLAVTSGQAMINRGETAGFLKGISVKIYAIEVIIDEDSGESFDNEVEVGEAIVTRSNAKQSYATIQGEDLGVSKGCVVRVVSSPANAGVEVEGRAESTFGTNPATEKKEKLTPGSSAKPW